MSESATYLNGTISVKRRSDDYMAWRIGDTALWALGSSPREAIGNLVMTHPDEIIAAALTARPDRDAAALEALLGRAGKMLYRLGRKLDGQDGWYGQELRDEWIELVNQIAAQDRTAPTERRGGDEPSLPPLSSHPVELDIVEVRDGTPGVYDDD